MVIGLEAVNPASVLPVLLKLVIAHLPVLNPFTRQILLLLPMAITPQVTHLVQNLLLFSQFHPENQASHRQIRQMLTTS